MSPRAPLERHHQAGSVCTWCGHDSHEAGPCQVQVPATAKDAGRAGGQRVACPCARDAVLQLADLTGEHPNTAASRVWRHALLLDPPPATPDVRRAAVQLAWAHRILEDTDD